MKIVRVPLFRPRSYIVPLIYIFLPSLPLALMAHSLALITPGYINLEYILIGAFSVFLPPSVVLVMLFLESIIDFANRISATYMLSVNDMLESLRSLPSLPASRILEFSAVFVLVIMVCALVALARTRPEDHLWVAGGLLLLVAIAAPVTALTRHYYYSRVDVVHFNYRLVRAPTYALASREAYIHKFAASLVSYNGDNSAMNSAFSHALAYLDRPDAVKSPNVVLIVVESWGLSLDAHLSQAIDAPYHDPRITHKYDVSYGTVAFKGTTVPAEARELCNSTMGFHIIVASSEEMNSCLPTLFHARNYQNIAIHGYAGTMFQRRIWYPKFGFDQSWFKLDLEKLRLPDCDGAFPGTCDAAIAGWIGSSFLSVDTGKPRFIYWITLNSHLPLPAHPPNLIDDGFCSTLPLLRDSVPLCSWFRLERNVNQSVQQLAMGPSARPTVFVVVGDHAPPFADPQLRKNFSSTDVPYVLLTPKRAFLQ